MVHDGRYRWTGGGFETQPDGQQRRRLSTGFTQYATAAYRNKITVDEIGDIYLVDGNGVLRWYRYDEALGAFTIGGRPIDTGWNRYELIVSAGPGVLYGRTSNGDLFRSRFEPASQRWIAQHLKVGAGWGGFKNLFSAGGDTLFGVQTDGDLIHYRYVEDSNTWTLLAKDIDDGWAVHNNAWATTNTCRLTDRKTPARPATPIQPNSPTVAIQRPAAGTAIGALEYLFADNIGRLRHAYQENPDLFGNIQWAAVPTDAAFTGRPALVVNPQGNVRLLAQNTNSDAWSFTRQPTAGTSWLAGVDSGGALASRPAAVKLTDGTLAAFGLDAGGALWSRRYDTVAGDLLAWVKLGGTDLTGELTVIAGPDNKASVFALNAAGTPMMATWTAGTLSAWTSLGGTGLTGTLSVVKLPGQVLRLFARDATGTVVTQQQGAGVWTPVGSFTAAGSPAAVLDPPTGRLVVVARGTDNEIHRVVEASTGTATWGDWLPLSLDASDPAATDPTITEFTGGTGQTYEIVFRNPNDATRVYTRQTPSGAAAARTAAAAGPGFTAHGLPVPPK
ncbi:tachylectin-related carbohydrate-binding protein [Actinoplanes sp. NBRC 103695]|uniref:tachylectin-related carbohydrate-binding protein n=1 Tax=Actinoplanes sp. NBRC 103695 TaxID=3032202 RepID=UPI0025556061|nr:tachylectin-related carbohydrate-binding protein [Actinoplanes sp. NBRC 103695]